MASGIRVIELANLAVEKLCGSKEFSPSDTDHAIAVLGQRFGLEICLGHQESIKYLERGVASHLRICTSTTDDMIWSCTNYPSETFLSCIAAFTLHGEQPIMENGVPDSRLKNCLKTLQDNLCKGMIDRGRAGELVSRLLWLLAKDLFVRTRIQNYGNLFYAAPGPNEWDGEFIDCRRVKVLDYLDFVFGKHKWTESVVGAFGNAYINFSHWVSMVSDIAGKEAHWIGYGSFDDLQPQC